MHTHTRTHLHLHTDTQSLRESYPRSKKSLPFHRGLLVHHFVAWPRCVFRGPCGPAARRVPGHLAVSGLLPSHQLQEYAASSNPSNSSQTQPSYFLPSPFSSAALPSPPVIQVTKPFSFILAQLPIITQKGEMRSEQTNRQQEVMFPGFAEGPSCWVLEPVPIPSDGSESLQHCVVTFISAPSPHKLRPSGGPSLTQEKSIKVILCQLRNPWKHSPCPSS